MYARIRTLYGRWSPPKAFAAYMQGFGVGLSLGMAVMSVTTPTEAVIVAISGLAVLCITAGYLADKAAGGEDSAD